MAFVSFRANLAGNGLLRKSIALSMGCSFRPTELSAATFSPGMPTETPEVGVAERTAGQSRKNEEASHSVVALAASVSSGKVL